MKVSKLMAMAMVCCAMSGVAMAQSDKPKGNGHDHKVDGHNHAAQPGDKKGMPEMSADDKAWMEAAMPGEMHKWIAKTAGSWDLKVKMMEPGKPVTESKATAVTTMFMDGRFSHSVVKGEMKMGEMTMPFEGAGTLGYNNTTKQFEGTWMDSMGTMTMFSTGKLDSTKKVLTSNSTMVCPTNNKPCNMRSVLTMKNDNEMVEEFYNDMTGTETKCMEITFTRAKGAEMQKKAEDAVKKQGDKK